METTQTATGWMYEKLIHTAIDQTEWLKILEQANNLHQEQIMDAFKAGMKKEATNDIAYYYSLYTYKICATCKESKPPKDFGKDSQKKDGLNINCSECYNARRRQLAKGAKRRKPGIQPKTHGK